MNVAAKMITAEELRPSQSQIDLRKAFSHLFQEEDWQKFFNGETVEFADPIVTFNGEFIVDGHHRWAEVMLINPDAKLDCLDFSNDEGIGEDEDVYEFIDRFDGVKASKDKIVMDAYHTSDKKLREYLFENMPDELKFFLCKNKIVDDNKDWGSMDVGKIVSVDYLLQNAKKLAEHKAGKGAPKRVDMPQLTEDREEVINNMLEE